MNTVELQAQPLSREAFAPYGEVIETEGARHFSINAGAIERYHDLATVDVGAVGGGRPLISVACCNLESELPYEIPFVERHPLGSQAFVPLDDTPLVVVVAPAGESVDVRELRAFVSNGRQGVNYHRGVWHIPLISLKQGQQHLVVDRGGPGQNCDEFRFPEYRIVVDV
jgi:ureidoglycolate lyase